MKKYLIGIAVLVFCAGKSLMAQQHLVDSLIKHLQQPMADSNRSVSMMRLAIDYEVIDTAKAYQAYRNAIAFALDKRLYFLLGRIHHNHSYLLSTAARYTHAMASLDTAILFYQKVNSSKARKWEASAYGDMANYFRNNNDLQKAVDYHLKSISMLEQLGLNDDLVIRFCNVSTLFGDIGELAKQKEYAHRAVSLARHGSAAINRQMAYTILAHAYSMQNDNKTAKIYLDSAKVSFNEYSNIDFMVTYYLITAQVFKKLDQPDSSFYYFERCLNVSKKYNYSYGKAESQIEMGAISILKRKYNDAEKYLVAGIEEAKAVNSFNLLDDGYRYLSDVYAATGRYKLAYEFFQKFKVVSDSLFSLESKKIFNRP